MDRNVVCIYNFRDASSRAVLVAVVNVGRDKMKIKRWEKQGTRIQESKIKMK